MGTARARTVLLVVVCGMSGNEISDEIKARIVSAHEGNRARPLAARLLANDPALVELSNGRSSSSQGMEKWEAQARLAELLWASCERSQAGAGQWQSHVSGLASVLF